MSSGWPIPERLGALLERGAKGSGKLLMLTGAGISAESGIPTFRGEEGYWRVGSRNYHPQEMATHEAFTAMPDEVWAWYLFRRGVCRAAEPNPAHRALVDLERGFGDRFLLVTQNVDGLHIRAGNSLARTYQIHGNIDFMRCSEDCSSEVVPVPLGVDTTWPRERRLGPRERELLVCPRCGARSRPHVLWFDESYDEERYRFESSIRAAREADLLAIVGTSGATNLPNQIASLVARRGVPLIVLNPEESPFTELADSVPSGYHAAGTAGELVPPIVAKLLGCVGAARTS